MDPADDRLSQINTLWSVVRDAHDPAAGAVQAAQRQLIERYGGAIRRYALASLRDEEAADEVFQEFALRFVRGDLGRADPSRGRFRGFLKTTIYHLIIDYQRRRGRQARQIPIEGAAVDPAAPTDDADDALFASSWRDDLLARVWAKLEEMQSQSGKPYHTALRCRVEFPDLRSDELATKLSERLGKPMQAGAARVLLHRSRDMFADMLLEEVRQSLANGDVDEIEQELIDLDLLQYCRPALDKLRGKEAED
ncbi:MAG: sigma-70 family RNA polymerase sigma factor [Pirellulales bacterium]